jgi:hypothetical protein
VFEKSMESYADVVQVLRNTNEEVFYTPSYRVTVKGIYQHYLEIYHTAILRAPLTWLQDRIPPEDDLFFL